MLRTTLVALLLATTAWPARAELTAEDRAALEAVFDTTPLFDPVGATWVRATVVLRRSSGSTWQTEREGWTLNAGGQEWLVLEDLSRARVVPDPPARSPDAPDFVRRMRELIRTATLGRGRVGRKSLPDLSDQTASLMTCRAAWALRLSHDDLAAELLAKSRALSRRDKRRTIARDVQRTLAWAAFAEATHAFIAGADDELLAALGRLEPLVSHAKEFGEAAEFVADIRRRQREGSLGRSAPPTDLASRPVGDQVTVLVASLEDVRRLMGWWIEAYHDPRMTALVALGDPAIPALLECLEGDQRLTRVLHFGVRGDEGVWRRELVPVSVAAREVLEEITLLYERSLSTTSYVAHVREHLAQHAGATPAERMRRALVGPRSAVGRRSAARRLAELGRLHGSGPRDAELILTGMDAELGAWVHGAAAEARRECAAGFLSALTLLGDRRILPTVRARFEGAADWPLRIELAAACEDLGDGGPLDDLAAEIAAGGPPGDVALRWSVAPSMDVDVLERLVERLGCTGRRGHDAALFSLAEPESPLHHLALRGVLSGIAPVGAGPWRAHPFCLRVLRAAIVRDLAVRTLGELLVGAPEEASPRATEFATRFVDRARRLTWVERAALGDGVFVPDFSPLGRPATAADVESGRALFHQDGLGRVAELQLPAVADVVLPSGPTRALVVQAEVTPAGGLRYGVLTLHHAGPIDADAVSACCPLPTLAEADEVARRLATAVSTGDLAEALRFARTDAQRRTLTSITRSENLFVLDEDALRWARYRLRPNSDGSWSLDD